MSYRSKKEALASIHERKHVRNGKEYPVFEVFLGYNNETRKPKRLYALDKDELKSKIAEFYEKLDHGGIAATTFNIYEATDARKALDLLAQKQSKLTLYECVRKVLDGEGGVFECKVSVADAYTLFIEAYRKLGKSENYITGLQKHVGKWVEQFGGDRMLSEITAQEVIGNLKKRFLKENDLKTWKTYNNNLGDIMTFVGWCAKIEQKFIPASPLAGIEKLSIPYRRPEYMKAEDVAKLFAVLEKHKEESPADLADAILSFFCGVRQSEIERVRLGEKAVKIDIEEGFLRVDKCKGETNGVDPRVFDLSNQALAWMKSFDFMSAVEIKNKKFRTHLNKRAKEAGIVLPKNAGRHTFITMHAAAYRDPVLLTSIVGNSTDVRKKHYDGIEARRNGEAYFKILPQNVASAT